MSRSATSWPPDGSCVPWMFGVSEWFMNFAMSPQRTRLFRIGCRYV
jgi:hypothetical protein